MARISFVFLATFLLSTPALSASLLFRSGFENNVSVAPVSRPYNTTSGFEDITGSDTPPFSWPIVIRNPTRSNFHHIINAGGIRPLPAHNLNRYFDTHIETVKGHDGTPTKALYQSLTIAASRLTQSWYEIYYSSPSDNSDKDLYVRYWMKFPNDLLQSMGPDNWRSIFFWKTASNDYRIEAYISSSTRIHPDGSPHWYIHGDNFGQAGDEYRKYWEVRRKDISVPIGEWFMVEFFWHRSRNEDGRIFWAINGQVIADHMGPNYGINDSHINRISLFGVYTKPAKYPARQWIDDVEIWDSFPCGAGISCYSSKQPGALTDKTGR